MKCSDCKFWRAGAAALDVDDEANGECRRHAPRPDREARVGLDAERYEFGTAKLENSDDPRELTDVRGNINNRFAVWPVTWGNDFCGDFYVADGKASVWA